MAAAAAPDGGAGRAIQSAIEPDWLAMRWRWQAGAMIDGRRAMATMMGDEWAGGAIEAGWRAMANDEAMRLAMAQALAMMMGGGARCGRARGRAQARR